MFVAIRAPFREILERILAALGRSWALLGRPWDACWALLARSWTLVGASGRSWALLGRSWEGLRWVLGGFGMGLGRVPGGFALLFAAGQLEFKFESSSR